MATNNTEIRKICYQNRLFVRRNFW